MATRWPFWKWHIWKSKGFFLYTLVMCYWSLDLIFKAKQKLESRNRKIQDGCHTTILKVTSLKINRLLPMATNNMPVKFQIEIPKQAWVTLRKPCLLQTDGQTDRRTRWFQYTPPPTSMGGGITISNYGYQQWRRWCSKTVNSLWPDDTIWHHTTWSSIT